MSEPFYPVESFRGQEVPLRLEADIYDCEIIGELPPELDGALYRAGPDAQYPSLLGDVIVNGDGMLSVFDFQNGHASFKSRYVHTERLLAERAARRRLYGKYRNRFTDSEQTRDTDRDNTGNTSAWFHAGKLFALREESKPHEIDLQTLATRPKWDFRGALKSSGICAHPKSDPVTGEWWSYSFYARGTLDADMALQVIDREGHLVREEFFRAPYAGLSHDFGVTREHVVFAIMPLTTDAARIAKGGDFYAYDPKLPSLWGIMRRDASVETIRWYRLPDAFSGHVMNAHTEGDIVHIDVTLSAGSAFPFFKDVDGKPVDPMQGIPQITRLSFDLSRKEDVVTRTPFAGAMGEMPRCDPRYAMSKYRYGYIAGNGGVARLDWQTHELAICPTPDGNAQEPVFVPRSAGSREGDGFVLSLVNKPQQGTSELYVIDSARWSEGPVAKVVLPFRQPMAFHGNFVARQAME